jgi:hypothetical protein
MKSFSEMQPAGYAGVALCNESLVGLTMKLPEHIFPVNLNTLSKR